jgi:hypothetical protein
MPKTPKIAPFIEQEEVTKSPPSTPTKDSRTLQKPRHYFQQFTETKRIVSRILKKHKFNKSVQQSSATIYIENGDNDNLPNQYPYFESQAVNPSSTVHIHLGPNKLQFHELDRKYVKGEFPNISRQGNPKVPIASYPNLNTNPLVDTTRQFPQWIEFREQLLQKLTKIVQLVLTEKQSDEHLLHIKRDFLMILASLQQCTLKLVEFYQQYCPLCPSFTSSEGFQPDHITSTTTSASPEVIVRWEKLHHYIQNLPTSLHWLDINPFRLWSGLYFRYNPLLTCYDLFGDLALSMNHRVHALLHLSNDFFTRTLLPTTTPPTATATATATTTITTNSHFQYHPKIMEAIAKELQSASHLHYRYLQANQLLLLLHQYHYHQEYLQNRETSIYHQSSSSLLYSPYHRYLDFLLFTKDHEDIDPQYYQISVLVTQQHAQYHQQRHWSCWQRLFRNEQIILIRKQSRHHHILQRCFIRFVSYLHRKYRIENFSQQIQYRFLSYYWDGWQQYLRWQKQYQQLYFLVQFHRKNELWQRWKHYIQESVNQRRNYQSPPSSYRQMNRTTSIFSSKLPMKMLRILFPSSSSSSSSAGSSSSSSQSSLVLPWWDHHCTHQIQSYIHRRFLKKKKRNFSLLLSNNTDQEDYDDDLIIKKSKRLVIWLQRRAMRRWKEVYWKVMVLTEFMTCYHHILLQHAWRLWRGTTAIPITILYDSDNEINNNNNNNTLMERNSSEHNLNDDIYDHQQITEENQAAASSTLSNEEVNLI